MSAECVSTPQCTDIQNDLCQDMAVLSHKADSLYQCNVLLASKSTIVGYLMKGLL